MLALGLLSVPAKKGDVRSLSSTNHSSQTLQFRGIPEHLWEQSEAGPPDTSSAAPETSYVDSEGWRHI